MRAIDATTAAPALVGALGVPVVLKPRDASGGRGMVVARDAGEVRAALKDGWIAERYVRGVELSVESLVQRGAVVFENVTEYLRPGWANVVPAALPERVDAAVRRLNRAAVEALEVEDGLTHLEAFVVDDDPDEEPSIVFGELACRPPGGSIMELLERAYGFDPWQTHIELELGRAITPPQAPRATAGVWFLHPGEGRVVAVDGLDRARQVEGIARVECSLVVGQLVARREGTGQHTGRIVADTGTRDEAACALETARSLIHVATDPLAA
ncbi:MAG: ATP-grasp domain-containing protein [Sandaracinaceae bacterium]|nr:ATP-grasp domain-containing protein [Sandaracinaceae bacterium]